MAENELFEYVANIEGGTFTCDPPESGSHAAAFKTEDISHVPTAVTTQAEIAASFAQAGNDFAFPGTMTMGEYTQYFNPQYEEQNAAFPSYESQEGFHQSYPMAMDDESFHIENNPMMQVDHSLLDNLNPSLLHNMDQDMDLQNVDLSLLQNVEESILEEIPSMEQVTQVSDDQNQVASEMSDLKKEEDKMAASSTEIKSVVEENFPKDPKLCVREGCQKKAVSDPEFDPIYCSAACVIRHCENEMKLWIENQKAARGNQNSGEPTLS